MLTHGWASQWDQISWYKVHITKIKKSGPISFWARHDTPNQAYSELEIYTSAEEKKIRNSQKLHKNQLQFQHWR